MSLYWESGPMYAKVCTASHLNVQMCFGIFMLGVQFMIHKTCITGSLLGSKQLSSFPVRWIVFLIIMDTQSR